MTDLVRTRNIVRKVLDNLLDRRGFRQVWDGCGQAVKAEIRLALQEIVFEELKRKEK
jgi:hypothetical protein